MLRLSLLRSLVILLLSSTSYAAVEKNPNDTIIAQIAKTYNSAKTIGDLENLIEPALKKAEFVSILARIQKEHVSMLTQISQATARANQLYIGPSTLILGKKGFTLNGVKLRKRSMDRLFSDCIADPHMTLFDWFINTAEAAGSKLEKIPGALAAIIAVKGIYKQ